MLIMLRVKRLYNQFMRNCYCQSKMRIRQLPPNDVMTPLYSSRRFRQGRKVSTSIIVKSWSHQNNAWIHRGIKALRARRRSIKDNRSYLHNLKWMYQCWPRKEIHRSSNSQDRRIIRNWCLIYPGNQLLYLLRNQLQLKISAEHSWAAITAATSLSIIIIPLNLWKQKKKERL